jgi:hypothetical protein
MSELFASTFTFNKSQYQPNKRHISDVETDVEEGSNEIFRQPTKRRRNYSRKKNASFQFKNDDYVIENTSISDLNKTINLLNDTSIYAPCLYIISIGKVKDLRVAMNIPERFSDDDMVYKIGYSDNIDRRLNAHRTTYRKINGTTCINLSYIAPLVNCDIRLAESEFKRRLVKMNIKLDYIHKGIRQTELIVASKNQATEVNNLMFEIAIEYRKKIADIIQPLEKEITELKHTLELRDSQYLNLYDKYTMSNYLINDLVNRYQELINHNQVLEGRIIQLCELRKFELGLE